jgi:NADH:ubiquinone oxidoreductase subunit F (NADH-binding)
MRLLELARDRDRPVDLRTHLSRYGDLPLAGYSGPRGPVPLADLAARVRLTGRGGAGFPIASKLRSVAAQGGRSAVVLANGAEGEPASGKDETLLTSVPHLVLDGAVLAADAVGADVVHVCVHRRRAAAAVAAAVRERERARLDGVRVAVHEVPDGYVASQETALINFLNGGKPLPTSVPPLPFRRGVAGRPTLVSNVETLAHLALLARYGAAWFAEVGTPECPGTTLLTVSGAVDRPGVIEVALGTRLGDVLEAAGPSPLQAVLIGGYFGTWVPARLAWGLRLTPDTLRAAGAHLGAGVLVALPEGVCGLAETLGIAEWLSGQNAGQCGPCFNGLPAIVDVLRAVVAGQAGRRGLDRLRQLLELVEGRGACRHPDGVARLVRSALSAFQNDVHLHSSGAVCPAYGRTA